MEKKKQNKYTDKQKKDALEAIKNGMTPREAADYAGVPISAVYNWREDKSPTVFNKMCECGAGPFTQSILYAQHRSTKHPHGGKRVMKSGTIPGLRIYNDRITNAFVDQQGGSHTVNETPEFEDKPQTINTEIAAIGKAVETYMAAHPVKISSDDFFAMLKNLVSENTRTKEELARLRKSLGEWQQRAGRIMEQAQELATKK